MSIFLAGDCCTGLRTGTRGKACPTPAHPGCRLSCYFHHGCRPYRYSSSSPVGETPPATSHCADINIDRARAQRTEDKSDKRDRRYAPLKAMSEAPFLILEQYGPSDPSLHADAGLKQTLPGIEGK